MLSHTRPSPPSFPNTRRMIREQELNQGQRGSSIWVLVYACRSLDAQSWCDNSRVLIISKGKRLQFEAIVDLGVDQ